MFLQNSIFSISKTTCLRGVCGLQTMRLNAPNGSNVTFKKKAKEYQNIPASHDAGIKNKFINYSNVPPNWVNSCTIFTDYAEGLSSIGLILFLVMLAIS